MKKNKLSVLWAHRLFEQSGPSLATPQHKTYFAHRYHGDPIEKQRNSFAGLLFGTHRKQTATGQDAAHFERFFKEGSAGTKNHAGAIAVAPAEAGTSGSLLITAPELTRQFTVLNCYDETPDTKTFRLGGEMFNYLPGQYITLSVTIQGQEYKRSYSLASSPSRPRTAEITVKRAPNGGLVSNWLNDHLSIGDTLKFKGPFGKFSCTHEAPPKILFLAAGSGIVPIMSMLRWLADTEARTDVRLLLSFRTPSDIIYRGELSLIAARHKNIHLAITLTTDSITRYGWRGLNGRVNKAMIAGQVPDLSERMVYLCGPDAFMAECKKNLLNLNLAAEKIVSESFTVTHPAIKSEDAGLVRSSRATLGNYRVNFLKSHKTMVTDGRTTLLELAEQAGIAITHECRSGSCGECMIKCLKGRIEMTEQAEIDAVDRQKGWVYCCCAYPASNVELDI